LSVGSGVKGKEGFAKDKQAISSTGSGVKGEEGFSKDKQATISIIRSRCQRLRRLCQR